MSPESPQVLAPSCSAVRIGLRLGLRLVLVSAAVLLALVAAEAYVASQYPLPATGMRAWLGPRGPAAPAAFRIDAEMGFCPIAPGPLYSRLGTLVNRYPEEKLPGRDRILFLGDSVTARGRIVRALERASGAPKREFWNAGVESFDTVQAVQWYERVAHAVRPDRVVLTLHPNDLLGTSVCFRDESGKLVLFRAGTEPLRVLPWLYPRSHLYRRFVAAPSALALPLAEAEQRSLAAVQRLQERLAREGIEFIVFALPWIDDPARWSSEFRAQFEATQRIAARSGAVWCDGLAALEQAVLDGIELQERPGDSWHPGDALAERFAATILETVQAALARGEQGVPTTAEPARIRGDGSR